jgi:hypothetical protein
MDAGHMTKDCSHLAVDGKKMWRAKETVMSTSKKSLKNVVYSLMEKRMSTPK